MEPEQRITADLSARASVGAGRAERCVIRGLVPIRPGVSRGHDAQPGDLLDAARGLESLQLENLAPELCRSDGGLHLHRLVKSNFLFGREDWLRLCDARVVAYRWFDIPTLG